MKTNLLNILGLAGLVVSSSAACAEPVKTMSSTASFIEMTASDGQTQKFADFLISAAPIVGRTEPGTKLWFALKAPQDKLAIFDVFVDEAARNAHFAGAVAGALRDSADSLVEGGWNAGVVANVSNSTVLSSKMPAGLYSATTATYIKLKAAPGQSEALADLLTAAGPIVANTEPKTLYWVSLRLDENNFAIFDIFADETGRADHFAGEVAALLKENSSELVEGGWDRGVVANVTNYEILAMK